MLVCKDVYLIPLKGIHEMANEAVAKLISAEIDENLMLWRQDLAVHWRVSESSLPEEMKNSRREVGLAVQELSFLKPKDVYSRQL